MNLEDGINLDSVNSSVKCPKCGQDMRQGYLFTSKDGAFSFADEVPGVTRNAKNAPGFVKITPVKSGRRVNIAACCCENCGLVQFQY